jgi:hypothetical protein
MTEIIDRPSSHCEARKNGASPSFLIFHYTETQNAAEAEDYFLGRNPHPDGGRVSAHYMIDEEGTILRYGSQGTVEATWEVPGLEPAPAWPSGLAASDLGDLLVVDRHGGRVLRLDARGRPAGASARRGWDPGLLLFPSAVVLMPDGRIAVADQGNGRVQVFRMGKEAGRQ